MNMLKRVIILLFLASLCLPSLCFSDTVDSHAVDSHAAHSHTHSPGSFEFGFSIEYIYLDEDEEDSHGHDEEDHDSHDEDSHGGDSHGGSESAVGMHLHTIYRLPGEGFQRHFGIGAGGEIIFTDDPHYGVMGSLAVYPWQDLTLMISPGVEFAKHDGNHESEFAMHYEASYSFDVGGFHLGPAIGFSHTEDSEHYSAGIHFGF